MHDMIAYWAKKTPHAIAVADETELSYLGFDLAINKLAAALRRLNLPETGLVALHLRGLKGLYVIERALDRLGLATVAMSTMTPPGDQLDLLKPAMFLTIMPEHAEAHPNTVVLTDEWFAAAVAGPVVPPPDRQPRADDLVRVVVSSGTTGRPKIIGVTRASLALRNESSVFMSQFSHASRLMLPMGPQSIGGYIAPFAMWSLGAVVTIRRSAKTYEEILRLRPNQLWITPGQLEGLLTEIPPGAPLVNELRVTAMGSHVSRALAERTRTHLTRDVWIAYGSTEITGVTFTPASILDRHPQAVGHVWPKVEMQVVGEDGTSLPAGEIGLVRMRQEGVFSGYMNETESATSPWRGGWFYPGDLGAFTADGVLIIHGRAAEVMNLGGVKIDPGAVDEVAKTCPGVADAAAFALADAAGVEWPWIAVVQGEGYDPAELLSVLKGRWPALRTVKVALIDAIPRNAMAKIERQRLKAMVRDAEKAARGATH